MNFLGHAWLSPPHAEILVGNFTADFVGSKPPHYWTEACVEGWNLHRAIDAYTDRHPSFKILKSELFPLVGHYAAVLADIWLDHILASAWTDLSQNQITLDVFCQQTYQDLHSVQSFFPLSFAGVFHRMHRENWLQGYARPNGMRATLEGLSFRSPGFKPILEKLQGPQPLVELLTLTQHPARMAGIQLLQDAQSHFQRTL